MYCDFVGGLAVDEDADRDRTIGPGRRVTRSSALLTNWTLAGFTSELFQRTSDAAAKFAPQIWTTLPPVVFPDDGERPPIDGVPSASSGVSSSSMTGSPPPVPGSGSLVEPVVLPSPLVAGSSVLPVGGAGGTSAGGGVSVVGDGTWPVVDLPSSVRPATNALVSGAPPPLTAWVRNSSRLPLPLMTGAPLAPGRSIRPSWLKRRVTEPNCRSKMKMSRTWLRSLGAQLPMKTWALLAAVANTTKRPS